MKKIVFILFALASGCGNAPEFSSLEKCILKARTPEEVILCNEALGEGRECGQEESEARP